MPTVLFGFFYRTNFIDWFVYEIYNTLKKIITSTDLFSKYYKLISEIKLLNLNKMVPITV